jgi:hypothetical protein
VVRAVHDHPEETAYLIRRWQGRWPAFILADILLNWAVPFVVLLFRSAKRNPFVLAMIAILILIGRWVDLFVMIFPSQGEALSLPGIAEAALALGATGILVLTVLTALGRAALVAVNDAGALRAAEVH